MLAAREICHVSNGRLLLFSTWFDRSEPDRPLFDPVTEGILHSKQLMSISGDDGHSWSAWRTRSTGDLMRHLPVRFFCVTEFSVLRERSEF